MSSGALPSTVGNRLVRGGLLALSLLVCAFLVLPIFAIVPLSFNAGSFLTYPLSGVSLRWYEELIGSAGWSSALRNSVLVATATTMLATPLGTLAALGLTRLASPLKHLLIAVLMAPMFVPVIVVAVATYFLYARLGLAPSFLGLILGHTALATPFVVLVVHASLQGFDSSLLRAGASLGARPVLVIARILLPLIAPGMFAAAVFAFTTSFDEIVVAMLLAGVGQKTLPLQMFDGVRDHISVTITAAATLLVSTSILLLGVVEILRRRRARLLGQPS